MIQAEAQYQINTVMDQTDAKTQRVEMENRKFKAAMADMENAMDEMKGALGRAEDDKHRALAEKDKTIQELTDAIIRQGVSMEESKAELLEAQRGRDEAMAKVEKLQAEIAKARVEADLQEARSQERLKKEKDRAELYKHSVGVWQGREASMPRTVVAKYVDSEEFKNFVERLTVGAYQMGALGYRNAVIESHPTISLEEADDAVPAVHVASTELSTTPPAPRFAMGLDDWGREIAPDTFEEDPAAEGDPAKDTVEVEESDADDVAIVEPADAPAVGEALTDEPSILDVLAEDPADPSTP